ncbi:MAG: hypothetical protein KHZ73_06870 [Lachnospiraceae bacterium]|nr:hypothetical protein [Lachnospiraceae bacterium]
MLFYSDRGAKNAPAYFITIFSVFQFFFWQSGLLGDKADESSPGQMGGVYGGRLEKAWKI